MSASASQFLTWVQSGDYASAKQALNEGFDMNTTLYHRRPILIVLQDMQAFDAITWMIREGADVNVQDPNGDTALSLSIEKRQEDLFHQLLEAGADINLANHIGTTPLLKTMLNEGREMYFKALMERNVDINQATTKGTFPLLVAVETGQHPFVDALLAKGVRATGEDNNGIDAVKAAVMSGSPKMLKKILDYAQGSIPLDKRSSEGSTAMSMAAEAMNIEMCLLLLRAGASPNTQTKNRFRQGLTPLMVACALDETGEASIVQEFLSKGADPLARTFDGSNAYAWVTKVSFEGKGAVIQALKEAGLDPAAPVSVRADSPIVEALMRYEQPSEMTEDGQIVMQGMTPAEVIEALIDMGFPTLQGAMPLSAYSERLVEGEELSMVPPPALMAFGRNKHDLGKLILEKGTPVNTLDEKGKGLLHHFDRYEFSQHAFERLTLFLPTASKDLSKPEQASVGKLLNIAFDQALLNNPKLAQQIKQTKRRPKPPYFDQESWKAILSNTVGTLGPLAAVGADWNLKGAQGATPAMVVAGQGFVEMLSELNRERKVDLLAQDDHGWSVFHYAVQCGDPLGAHEVVRALGEQGLLEEARLQLHEAILSLPDADTTDHTDLARRDQILGALTSLTPPAAWLNAQDDQGNTPLILAAALGEAEVVSWLIAHGADLNQANHAGETALHQAGCNVQMSVMRDLIGWGADLDAQTQQGLTLFDMPSVLSNPIVAGNAKGTQPHDEETKTAIREAWLAQTKVVQQAMDNLKEQLPAALQELGLADWAGSSAKPAKGLRSGVKITIGL